MDYERVRNRAYALWENAGQPDGAHDEHWQQASRDIEVEDSVPSQAAPPDQENKDKAHSDSIRAENDNVVSPDAPLAHPSPQADHPIKNSIAEQGEVAPGMVPITNPAKPRPKPIIKQASQRGTPK